MSCTTQGRAAKPPSSVIQPGWHSDLRASRLLVTAIPLLLKESPHTYPPGALKTIARGMESQGYFRGRERPNKPAKAGFRRLAHPHKGHYTFARLRGHAAKVCSLRLSVRTPPFHGGESGSIPLGSAKCFPKKRWLKDGALCRFGIPVHWEWNGLMPDNRMHFDGARLLADLNALRGIGA